MKKFISSGYGAVMLIALVALPSLAQQVKRPEYDITNYVIDAALAPAERKLNATVDVTFVPGEDARTFFFELNGSLKVDSVISRR